MIHSSTKSISEFDGVQYDKSPKFKNKKEIQKLEVQARIEVENIMNKHSDSKVKNKDPTNMLTKLLKKINFQSLMQNKLGVETGNMDEKSKLRMKEERAKIKEFLENLENELIYGYHSKGNISVDEIFGDNSKKVKEHQF